MSTLILSGFGTNCERETAYACERGGAPPDSVSVRHINEIYSGNVTLDGVTFLVLIGGFMDGDDLGGARACANRFRFRPYPGGGTFLEHLEAFVNKGGLVLGVCNGFQLLVRLGLIPGEDPNGSEEAKEATQSAGKGEGGGITLTTNANGRFEDRWVRLRGDPSSNCVFTRGIDAIELPVRHGEGRVLGASPATLGNLVERNMAPLRYTTVEGDPTEAYPANPNGTHHGVAALCNARGTVMGLMPHPEGFNHYTNHPRWTRREAPLPDQEDGEGIALFRNAYTYLSEQAG